MVVATASAAAGKLLFGAIKIPLRKLGDFCLRVANPRKRCRIFKPLTFNYFFSPASMIISSNAGNEIPAAAAAFGNKLASVMPGIVLVSRI